MKRRKVIGRALIMWGVLVLTLCIIAGIVFIRLKSLIFTAAKSRAETLLINSANRAVLNVLEENGVAYDDISAVSRDSDGNITGIEIDIVRINTVKALIAEETARIADGEEYYRFTIPLGTLSGIEALTGIGPRITFRMQMTQTVWVDFESVFEQAGINQTLHRILINTDISAGVLMLGCTESFSVNTSTIAAQTVIVGEVPGAFTQVIEGEDGDVVSDIFDYGVLEE